MRRTLILSTSDHGGHGRTHGSAQSQDTRISWMAFGGAAARGELPQLVQTLDAAPAVLRALGLPIPRGIEGSVVAGALGPERGSDPRPPRRGGWADAQVQPRTIRVYSLAVSSDSDSSTSGLELVPRAPHARSPRTLAPLALALASLSLGLWGCATETGADPDPIRIERAECENLNPFHCGLPYPSNHFLREDPSTETGWRVDFSTETLPMNQLDEPVASLHPWNAFDGFSPMTAAMTFHPGPLDPALLAGETRIAESLLSESTTIWLDAETGARVPHWAELDGWPRAAAEGSILYLRPAVRLEPNRGYILATRGLRHLDGSAAPPSAYFRALRDDEPTEIAELEARRGAYESIFSTLEAAGVERSDLIEAWEFRTASESSLSGEMLALRDAALLEAGARGIGCTVTTVEEDVNAETFRRIRGTFTVPLYLTHPYEGAVANRDASGSIVQNGYAEARFEADIPVSVRDAVLAGGAPGPGLMFGHGAFGNAEYAGNLSTRIAASRLAMTSFTTDFWGLSSRDSADLATEVLTQFGNFDRVGEALMQGMVNSLLLARSFRGVCAELPEFTIAVGAEVRPLLDASTTYFYGRSMGAVLGGSFAALTPDIERFVLQVGGMGFTQIIPRSALFAAVGPIAGRWHRSELDVRFLLTSTQTSWDRVDPATYARFVRGEPLPGSSPRRICYQAAVYDEWMPNVLSDMAAEAFGLPFFEQSVHEPWRTLERTRGPAEQGYTTFLLEGTEPLEPGAAPSGPGNNVHDDIAFVPSAIEQMVGFLRPGGAVESFCPADRCEVPDPRP
ncbi:MAG: hypothetical protein OEY14_03865 [Myxococcales bacterium]|nr:hypothetical protein [Myxococcales bacterium]